MNLWVKVMNIGDLLYKNAKSYMLVIDIHIFSFFVEDMEIFTEKYKVVCINNGRCLTIEMTENHIKALYYESIVGN